MCNHLSIYKQIRATLQEIWTSDPQRNAMSQSAEMPPLVPKLFRTFLNPLESLMETLIC